MFRKLFVTFILLWAGGLALLGLLASGLTRDRMMSEVELRLDAELEVARREAARHAEPGALQAALAALARRREIRLTLIAADGRVLADSHADPGGMASHLDRPEVRQARQSGRGRDVRSSGTVGYPMMYLARPLEAAPGAVLRAAIPLDEVEAALSGVRFALLVSFGAITLIGGLVTFFMVRRLTQPLREIRFVADWVAAGDFSRKAPEGPDEIGRVSVAFNHMAAELQRRLDSLRAERARLEAVISSMEDSVVSLDGTGGVLHANSATRTLFQITNDPAGLPLWEAIRLPGLQEAVRPVLDGGASVKRDFEVGPRTLSVRLSPLSAGKGAILVARDITEDRRYDELRKEFVANVSHELRTPLTMIQGYVETLREGAWREEKSLLEFLGIIDRNVQRLSAIVRDLLDLSKLESGGRGLQPGRVDLGILVEGVVSSFRPLAAARRQDFRGLGSGEGDVDETLLERALANLVENAIKYTAEGGRIELRARRQGDRLIFEVEDNGAGIPEADLPRVFERFYRVDKSRSRDLGGTGLGLSIVKHVAQLHGGTVSVRSRVGQGSTFTLDLPAQPA